MIKDAIAKRLENLPTGHSDRIMSMRLPLHKKQHATIFSVYAPTLQAEQEDKEKFYWPPTTYSCWRQSQIVLGDFNARVGKDSDTWKGVLGKHDVGNCNDNGRLLLELCADQQLVITNTIF